MGETKLFCQDRMAQLRMTGLEGMPMPEERDVIAALQDTYEAFQLPERNFQIAAEDVRKSYGMLRELEKERMPEEEWDR